MIIKVFRNVSCFQVFIPEKRGWLHYRRSWAEDGVWLCEFNSQDSKKVENRRAITEAYAEEIWHRFKTKDTCETIYAS